MLPFVGSAWAALRSWIRAPRTSFCCSRLCASWRYGSAGPAATAIGKRSASAEIATEYGMKGLLVMLLALRGFRHLTATLGTKSVLIQKIVESWPTYT